MNGGVLTLFHVLAASSCKLRCEGDVEVVNPREQFTREAFFY
jgi:hypothetical protein